MGIIRKVALTALGVLALCSCGPKGSVPAYSWDEDLQYRLGVDFSWTRDQVKEYIQQYIPDVTDEAVDQWTESGLLETMEIDGQLRYFRRTASNLFRLDPECIAIKAAADRKDNESLSGTSLDDDDEFDSALMRSTIAESAVTGQQIVLPKKMRVRYTLTVNADAVPAGETIRCWLPYPRSDVARQTDVKFLGADPAEVVFSDPACIHSTLYQERKAVEGEPTVFVEEFEYTAAAEWHDLSAAKVEAAAVKAIGKSSFSSTSEYYLHNEEYDRMTSERETHIIFSDRMKALADSLTVGLVNPYDMAWAIFKWVNDEFPWAGAREYSTLENIPEYVLDIRHGDCGQVTLLFITLCRIVGIPAHFQSGFMMHPGNRWNLHDWGEVYFEGIGWVPVDQSFGIPLYATDETMERFFLGGIDCYRMVVNQDYGMELSPAKTFPRSETVDFQRGEVEWRGGNLYFPDWDYDMEIEYLN